jgi:hypothetical protein
VLGIEPPGSRTLTDDARNRVELPLDRLQPGWWPVAGLLITCLGSAPEGTIRALHGATVLSQVVAAFLAAPNQTLLHRFFGHGASLSRLPAWELAHGRDGTARLDATARLLDSVLRPGPQGDES